MSNENIIKMLNQDLEGEHAAIIQYLGHAYAMGEGEMACGIEAIAREEMRHFDWLSEKIVELGGKPTLERGTMRQGGESVADWMKNNVQAETDAIALYGQHIEAIADPEMKRLLHRILSDEESHHNSFTHLVKKAKQEGAKGIAGARKGHIADMLNWGIEHEYTVVLQYLLHSYMTTNEEVKGELQDQAINEMQHLGWLAEKIVDKGGTPRIEHTGVDQSTDTAKMLEADIRVEREVAKEYTCQIEKTREVNLKTLLTRIRDHEIYHDELFSDLLRGVKKGK